MIFTSFPMIFPKFYPSEAGSPRYEPNALGFEASALHAMLGALCAWSGGLLLATQQAMEGGTWERWSLEDVA